MAQVRSSIALASLALALVAGCSEAHVGDQVDGGQQSDALLPDARVDRDAHTGCGPSEPCDSGFDAAVMPSSCEAQDAVATVCASLCDGPDSYAWDGEQCNRIDCGACAGTDCGSLPSSQAACEAAHATCVPEMCRATGGQWLFWAQECQHYRCGNPQPAECLVGMPVCDCGDHRSFDFARGGCFDDATCPEVDPLPPMELCNATGGTWTPGICCDSHCGAPCDLACAAPACVCGPLQIFDGLHGCVDDAQCHVRTTGGDCGDQVRCEEGLICCQHCGGAGCDPTTTCTAPVCDADPHIDTCGNMLFAP